MHRKAKSLNRLDDLARKERSGWSTGVKGRGSASNTGHPQSLDSSGIASILVGLRGAEKRPQQSLPATRAPAKSWCASLGIHAMSVNLRLLVHNSDEIVPRLAVSLGVSDKLAAMRACIDPALRRARNDSIA